jgi:ribose transport system ATP-binding protein
MQGIDHDAIIKKMVGREITTMARNQNQHNEQELLTVQNLELQIKNGHQKNILKKVSFSLKRGEILGIFGLMGAGRTELLECILGMHTGNCTGTILMEGQPVKVKSPREAIKAGIVLVPEDRKKDGLVLGLDVKTNISLSNIWKVLQSGFLNRKKEIQLAQDYTNSLRIKTPSPHQVVKNLSGGNQQKVVLARCLATNPKVLMLDEPTRGIDVNAKNEIYKLIFELAESGLGIIVVSSELPEILAISDRILVMSEGKITAAFTGAEANEDNIIKAAIPKTI